MSKQGDKVWWHTRFGPQAGVLIGYDGPDAIVHTPNETWRVDHLDLCKGN